MRAAWYEPRGPARNVLVVGEMPDPAPGVGEVRIRLAFSGINPGDVKKRSGWQGSPMPYPHVVPHSDGAGVIDAVGPDVPAARVGQAVWCYGAQSYRAFGTAAERVVVPAALAVPLPDGAGAQPELLEQAACLGIAGITGYRAVFAGGPVAGLDVLVWGAASGVGAVALQMAHRAGARVLAVVRRAEQLASVRATGAAAAWLADDPTLVDQIRLVAPAGDPVRQLVARPQRPPGAPLGPHHAQQVLQGLLVHQAGAGGRAVGVEGRPQHRPREGVEQLVAGAEVAGPDGPEVLARGEGREVAEPAQVEDGGPARVGRGGPPPRVGRRRGAAGWAG